MCLFMMMLHSIKVLMLYYIHAIMHVIAEYWLQLVKQEPNCGLGLFIKMIGPFSSILGLLIVLR